MTYVFGEGIELELWTVQHAAVYQELLKTGSYKVDPAYLAFPPDGDDALNHCHGAYLWLVGKMEERIGPRPDGCLFPIWAWFKQRGRKDGKPDMRCSGYGETGTPLVRLRMEIPDGNVLLSDFDEWHFALNHWYLSRTEQEDEDFVKRCDDLGIPHRDLADFNVRSKELATLRGEIVSSWERMLDVFSPRDERWGFRWEKRCIQATFWTLSLSEVISCETFRAR